MLKLMRRMFEYTAYDLRRGKKHPPITLEGPACPLSHKANCVSFWNLLQERPCTRCIKRNIGHLCHDEPRETSSKKAKGEQDVGPYEPISPKNEYNSAQVLPVLPLQDESGPSLLQDDNIRLRSTTAEEIAAPSQGSASHGQGLNGTNSSCETTSSVRCLKIDLSQLWRTKISGWRHKITFKTCTVFILHICSTLQK